MWQSMEILKVFSTLIVEQTFWKMKTDKKTEVPLFS